MRALLSVYDKTGITDLAAGLDALGWELVSSGGTAKAISDAGSACRDRGRGDGVPRDARTPCRDPPPEDPRGDSRRPRRA